MADFFSCDILDAEGRLIGTRSLNLDHVTYIEHYNSPETRVVLVRFAGGGEPVKLTGNDAFKFSEAFMGWSAARNKSKPS